MTPRLLSHATASISLTAMLVAACFPRPATANEAPPSIEQQVYDWLIAQQMPNGLVENQEEDKGFSSIYPNALTAICFLHQGDRERAERIFDFFDQRFEAFFSSDIEPGFHQHWNGLTSEPYTETDRWLGDTAWLLIALNYHEDKTGESKYQNMREGLAQWIIRLQDEDGGVYSGYKNGARMDSKSTEGNLDAYAALVDYPEERDRIKQWIIESMWNGDKGYFQQGSTSDASALDCASWAVCALGKSFAYALPYAEATMKKTDTAEANGARLTGFSDFPHEKRLWYEGTGEMAVAYQVAGMPEKAAFYIGELERAMIPSEQHEGTMGLPCDSSDPVWLGASTRIFTPSQAWYLFAEWHFNPMVGF